MQHSQLADGEPTAATSPARRVVVRIFAGLMIVLIAMETAPSPWPASMWLKNKLWLVTKPIGLSQGEWPLFAPDPVINNAWVTAEIVDPDGQLRNWNSTYWANASSWEKFRRFRYINYFNRMPFRGPVAANDFADFIAQQEIAATAQPVPDDVEDRGAGLWKMTLIRSQLNMAMPPDGSLPTRDEVVWVSSSTRLAERVYRP